MCPLIRQRLIECQHVEVLTQPRDFSAPAVIRVWLVRGLGCDDRDDASHPEVVDRIHRSLAGLLEGTSASTSPGSSAGCDSSPTMGAGPQAESDPQRVWAQGSYTVPVCVCVSVCDRGTLGTGTGLRPAAPHCCAPPPSLAALLPRSLRRCVVKEGCPGIPRKKRYAWLVVCVACAVCAAWVYGVCVCVWLGVCVCVV